MMASSSIQAPKEDNRSKVKVYQLSTQTGEWTDKGTGHIEISEQNKAAASSGPEILEIQVLGFSSQSDSSGEAGHDDEEVLLTHVVRATNSSYQQQQGTLIVWEDYEGYRTESYALSFLVKEGCDHVWNLIKEFQQRHSKTQVELGAGKANGLQWEISLDTVDDFATGLHERLSSNNAWFKTLLAEQLREHGLLQSLYAIFDKDSQAADALAQIMLAILQAVEEPPIEVFVSDDTMPKICQIFDAALGTESATLLAEVETAEEQFEADAPISDPAVRKALRENARCQILRDVILARASPESIGFLAQTNAIWPLEYGNYAKIFEFVFLKNDGAFLRHLVHISKQDTSSVALPMLAEFVRRLAHLPETNRARFYGILISSNVFEAIETVLSDTDMTRRTRAIGVMCQMIENNLAAVRKECLELHPRDHKAEGAPRKNVLDILIEKLHSETDFALLGQLGDMIRKLLELTSCDDGFVHTESDVPTDQQTETEFESFLTMFYHYYINDLMAPLRTLETEPNVARENVDLVCLLCDLLCFLIRAHGYRAKFSIMDRSSPANSTLFSLVTKLCYCGQPLVQLAALRVIRTAASINEKFWEDLLVTSKTLYAVVDMFSSVKHRLNLLNAACLELFEFILKTPRKRLLKYLVEECLQSLDDVTYVDVFASMRRRYKSWLEPPSGALAVKDTEPPQPTNEPHGKVTGSSPFWSCGSKRSFDETQLSDEADTSNAFAKAASASPSSFASASSFDFSPLRAKVLSDEEEDLDAGIFRNRSPGSRSPKTESPLRSGGSPEWLSKGQRKLAPKKPPLQFVIKDSEDSASSLANQSKRVKKT